MHNGHCRLLRQRSELLGWSFRGRSTIVFLVFLGLACASPGPVSVNEVGPIRRMRGIISTRRPNDERQSINARGEGKPLKVNGLAKVEVVMWFQAMTHQKTPRHKIPCQFPKETAVSNPSREQVGRSEINLLGK